MAIWGRIMSGGNFSAFYRNKSGYRRSPPSSSNASIDFRFRNAEKWFDERRAFLKPPGLKKPVPPPSDLDEICIPSYDEFDYVGSNLEPDSCVNLLPDNWESIKWRQGMAKDVRSAWFRLPPDIQEGECKEYSVDLPLFVYNCGQISLNAIPSDILAQHDYFMMVFQHYYNKYLFGV
jgi:hypothetical protein